MLRWIGWNVQTAVMRRLPRPVRRWLYWHAIDREWTRLVAQSRRRG